MSCDLPIASKMTILKVNRDQTKNFLSLKRKRAKRGYSPTFLQFIDPMNKINTLFDTFSSALPWDCLFRKLGSEICLKNVAV